MKEFFISFIIGAISCSIGFKYYIWFFSIGYGIAIAAIGIYLLIIFNSILVLETILSCILFIVYGLRLSIYLGIRESKSSYNDKMKGEIKPTDTISMIAKISIWISCSLLYAFMTCPVTFRLMNTNINSNIDILYRISLIITLLGIIIETLADYQKNSAKKNNPHRFVDTGLYKIVRCPNYFGELLLWTGVFIGGINIYYYYYYWIFAILGYILIIYVMFSGTRRLEIRQNKSYSNDNEYQEYIKNTPILIPLIPIYSVEKYTWLVA